MTLLEFLKALIANRTLLWSLTKNYFKQKYVGNFLGAIWAIIQPAATIMIFWFVFQVGFKSKPVDDYPFILWLVAGMFPWFFISEALSFGTEAIISNAFLVKKIVFRVSLLPVIPLLSALIVHLFFLLFMAGMFIYYGYTPSIYWLQTFYYTFAALFLLLGLSWLTSSVVVFFKDMSQIVAMVLQFGFWLTPIFWSIDMIPQRYHWLIKLNPFVYIIEGYRDSMIYHRWFWEKPGMTLYFWVVALCFFVLGAWTFRKLRPHFADVL
jgi:lipopolysaccharide transport system permease protein/teichoic acid transport system permease protein